VFSFCDIDGHAKEEAKGEGAFLLLVLEQSN